MFVKPVCDKNINTTNCGKDLKIQFPEIFIIGSMRHLNKYEIKIGKDILYVSKGDHIRWLIVKQGTDGAMKSFLKDMLAKYTVA